MHICTSPKSTISQDGPRSHTPQHQLTAKPVPCTTSLGTRQLVNPWSKYGRNCPMILASRLSATFVAITRADSAADNASRHFVHHGETSTDSCRSHFAESLEHLRSDITSTSWSTWTSRNHSQKGAHPTEKQNCTILFLAQSSQVIEERHVASSLRTWSKPPTTAESARQSVLTEC